MIDSPSRVPRRSLAAAAVAPAAAATAPAVALAAALWLAPLGQPRAELRVLLAFDAGGHRVERVVRGGSSTLERLRERARPGERNRDGPDGSVGRASLVWLDADGRTLAVERVDDPRVARAPVPAASTGGGAVATADAPVGPGARAAHRRVAIERGGWIARGPDAASALVLRLPARAAVGLDAAEWRFELDPDGADRPR